MENVVEVNVYGVFDDGKLVKKLCTRSDDECNFDWAYKEFIKSIEILDNPSFRLLETNC